MPVEPVWVGSIAIVVCGVHRCGRPLSLEPRVLGPVLLLALAFVPGAVVSGDTAYDRYKLVQLLLVIAPVLVASMVLLDSPQARRCWVWAQLVTGALVAAAAALGQELTISRRLTLATVDTISTGRFVGAAVLVLVLIALTRVRQSWWALPLAALCGIVLVQVGSRGPLLFSAGAVLATLLAGRLFAGRRLVFASGLVVLAAAAYPYAVKAGGAGGRRALGSLSYDLQDITREQLLGDALRAGSHHPFGVGWGELASSSAEARRIADAQGGAYAHNVFAECFSEGGLVALLAIGLVTVLALSRLQRCSWQRYEAIALGTVIYWLLNAQVSLDIVGNRFMWISLGCALAATPRSSLNRAARRELEARRRRASRLFLRLARAGRSSR